MSFPYSLYQTFVAGTRIGHDFLNAIQQGIGDAFNGNKRFKKIEVNSTTAGATSVSSGSISASDSIGAGGAIVAGTGIVSTLGDITAVAGNVAAGAGVSAGTTVAAGTTVTAGTNVVATAGAVLAGTTVTGSTGVVATAGNVQATAGQVIATGTPAGATGPGVVKAKRFYGSGTALQTTDFGPSGGWGSTGAVQSVTGTDAGFRVVCRAAGTGITANPTLTLTFKDLTMTNAPIAVACLDSASDGTGTEVSVASTATTVVLRYEGTPNSGVDNIFHCIVIGR